MQISKRKGNQSGGRECSTLVDLAPALVGKLTLRVERKTPRASIMVDALQDGNNAEMKGMVG